MNYHYSEEESLEQGWQQQQYGNGERNDSNWAVESTEASRWVNTAPVRHQSSTTGDDWSAGPRYMREFDQGAVPGHQYPQMVSTSMGSLMPFDGNLPHSQAFLDRSGTLLAPGIPSHFPPYNPSPPGIRYDYDGASMSYFPPETNIQGPGILPAMPGQSRHSWSNSYAAPQSPRSHSSSGMGAHSPPSEPQLGNVDDSVACPYGCGTVLTGVHAFGNLTRHLKTKGCSASGRAKVEHLCRVHGCGRKYSRSDGLRVHMRRRHGASISSKSGSSAHGNEDEL